MNYMDGWRWATRMIEVGFTQGEVTAYASFLLRQEPRSLRTQGFLAAVHAAAGG